MSSKDKNAGMWTSKPRREWLTDRMYSRKEGRVYKAFSDHNISDALYKACGTMTTRKTIYIVKTKKNKYRIITGGVLAPKNAVFKLTRIPSPTGTPPNWRVRESGASRKTDTDCSTYKYDYAYRKGSERRRKGDILSAYHTSVYHLGRKKVYKRK